MEAPERSSSEEPPPTESFSDSWMLLYQPAVILAMKQFLAGAISGVCAKTLIAPLDRAKILFQVSQERFSYAAVVRQVKATIAQEGFKSLYKGNFATVSRFDRAQLLLTWCGRASSPLRLLPAQCPLHCMLVSVSLAVTCTI
jgi:hypothetical protein